MTTVFSRNGRRIYPVIVQTNTNLQSLNFYIIQDQNSLSIIDAGYENDECWEALNKVMEENNFSFSDVGRIILTHHHQDHVGLVNRILKENHKIPVYAHPDSLPRLSRDPDFISMRINFFNQLYREMGCGAVGEEYIEKLKERSKNSNHLMINAETITPLHSEVHIIGLQPIGTPGHAIDHYVYYDKKNKWLFAGDLLLSHTSTNALVEPDENGKRMRTLVEYRKSLQKCLLLDVNVTFPGHQDIIYEHKPLIKRRLEQIDKKAARLLQLVQKGLTTANEIAQTYYKRAYKSQFALVMSEIIGHLDYLEENAKVYSKLKNGIRHYYVT